MDLQGLVDSVTGPTGGWLISPKEFLARAEVIGRNVPDGAEPKELVLNRANALIDAIDDIAREHDSCDFGLPYADVPREKIVALVVEALAARHVPVGTGWISVEEKLPEMDGTEYLICRSGYMASGLEFKNGLEIEAANGQAVWYGFHTRGFGVTHWQPLPASPLAHSPEGKET